MINQLGKTTTEEKEILNIVLEECSEVIQCISKVFRFGWDSTHPLTPDYTNKEHLTEELGDLMCMILILIEKNIIDNNILTIAAADKVEKLKKFSNIDLLNFGVINANL